LDEGMRIVCHKCETGLMVDDSHHDIKVIKCLACGERVYAGYPKRWGALVCSRCGRDLGAPNQLTLCPNCQNVLGIRVRPLRGRTYGETICPCGTTFTRKSPSQVFHSTKCKSQRTACNLQSVHSMSDRAGPD